MKKIFVGNLDTASTEAAIRSLFEPHGTVDGVKVITDRDTGRPRGFAFVEMADSAEADRAISALNGADLDGRPLKVNEARPKPPSSGGFGNSFRGSRGNSGNSGPRQRREPRW